MKTFYIRLSSSDGGKNYQIAIETTGICSRQSDEGVQFLSSDIRLALAGDLRVGQTPEPRESDFGLFEVRLSEETEGDSRFHRARVIDLLDGTQQIIESERAEGEANPHLSDQIRQVVAFTVACKIDPYLAKRYTCMETRLGTQLAMIDPDKYSRQPDFRLPDPALFGRSLHA